MAGRKDVLLFDPDGQYELSAGSIDTTDLAPGHYTLVLVPQPTVNVLRSDVDLSVVQTGGVGDADELGQRPGADRVRCRGVASSERRDCSRAL